MRTTELTATTAPRGRLAISLVEKGWSAARRAGIAWVQRGGRIEHLVKGTLSRELLQQLTPYPATSITGVPRNWFRALAWLRLLTASVGPGTAMVIVDSERALAWFERRAPGLRGRFVLALEQAGGEPTLLRNGAPITIETLIQEHLAA